MYSVQILVLLLGLVLVSGPADLSAAQEQPGGSDEQQGQKIPLAEEPMTRKTFAGDDLYRADHLKSLNVMKGTEAIGEISELLVDPENMKVNFAVMSYGGYLGIGREQVIVPWEDLAIGPQGELTLRFSDFDPTAARIYREDGDGEALEDEGRGDRSGRDLGPSSENGAKQGEASDAAEESREAGMVEASRLTGVALKDARDEELGNVESLVVDPLTGEIPLALIAVNDVLGLGGELRPVPLKAMEWKDDVFRTDISKEKLKEAPMISASDAGYAGLTKTEAQEVYSYYGLQISN